MRLASWGKSKLVRLNQEMQKVPFVIIELSKTDGAEPDAKVGTCHIIKLCDFNVLSSYLSVGH